MSSTNAFILDWSQILLFGKELSMVVFGGESTVCSLRTDLNLHCLKKQLIEVEDEKSCHYYQREYL